jgi:hypothetical protein
VLYRVDAYLFQGSQLVDSQDFRLEASSSDEAERKASDTLRFHNSEQWASYQVGIYLLERTQSWHVELFDCQSSETKKITVLAHDSDDARALAIRQLPEGQHWWQVDNMYRARGGYRPGAGREPENRPKKTVVKRIPVEMAGKLDKIDSLLQLIEDWKERSDNSPETSPRWERCREMLSEISELLGE